MFTSSLKFRIMAIVAYASVNVAEHPVRTQVKQSTRHNVHILTRARKAVIVAYASADVAEPGGLRAASRDQVAGAACAGG